MTLVGFFVCFNVFVRRPQAKEFEKKTKLNIEGDKRARAKLLVSAELAKEVGYYLRSGFA